MPKDDQPSPEELERRRRWFAWYIDRIEHHSVIREAHEGETYASPCCGHYTLDGRAGYDICPVCFWEDDGQDEDDADTVRGGPNGSLSLTQARLNYREFGACETRSLEHIRPPRQDEIRPKRGA